LYPINWDRSGAVLIGRYPEDRYPGHPGPRTGGNPWVLTTHAFAEFYYRVARDLGVTRPVAVNRLNREFFLSALCDSAASKRLPDGTILSRSDPQLLALRQAIVHKGDGFLHAVRERVADRLFDSGQTGGLPEQIHRTTGRPHGAKHLTWSYASYMSARRARGEIGDRRLTEPEHDD
jgi:glucoamylase